MPVNPLGERSVDLSVFKKPIPLICGMQCNPTEETNAEFHARAGLDSARSADHPHRRERRRQQREGILPFVEAKNVVYWCIDEYTLDERRHAFSLLALPSTRQELPPEASRNTVEGTGKVRSNPAAIEVTFLGLNPFLCDEAAVNALGIEGEMIAQD